MAATRRTLVTSAVAGGLLCAVWFIPSANASGSHPADARPAGPAQTASAGTSTATAGEEGSGPRLAETGTVDTTPYVVGGVAFLAAGAGLVAHAARRSPVGV
ncbi:MULTISPECIES: hypothetical protein [unclassified Streptomyces]|uniref:hypothetical protein n=1 Tax=unclassified Streptomyces TaxID=2593676 RepID=UPI0022B74844|nr:MULTISPECIES: hypothetical protein [unclassified Streptomyces]MCZ7416887.1 hypothetical protein [Streptomyces sp. WMMC897]MCZ7433296.1 hypothetical protein [Streptomyces sp. WMMC1477]